MARKIFDDELKVKKSFDYEQFSKKTFNKIELGSKSTYNYKSKNNNSTNQNNNSKKQSNEVVVKITGDSKHFESLTAHLDYISRNGDVELFFNEWDTYLGKENNISVKDRFRNDNLEFPKENEKNPKDKEKREAVHIVFSMREHSTTPEDKLKKAVLETLNKKYPDNLSVCAFHNDTDNPHIHAVLKLTDINGKRTHIYKKDLNDLRTTFAKELNSLGIEATATIKKNYENENRKNHFYKVVEFGEAKYKFSEDENAKNSYYIKYETKSGIVDLWSDDLKRVVSENNLKVGEYAKFKVVGQKPVEISINKKVNEKNIIFKKNVLRNVWDCSILGREKELTNLTKVSKEFKKYSFEMVEDGATNEKVNVIVKAGYFKLVDFGVAKYEFSKDENATDNYYVKFETNKGISTLWSKDFERLVKENNLKVGEFVKFKNLGQVPTKIKIQKTDKDGKKSLVDKTVLKNMWDCDVLGRDTKTKSNDKNIERS